QLVHLAANAVSRELLAMVSEAVADVAVEGGEKAVDHRTGAVRSVYGQRPDGTAGPAADQEVGHVGDVVGVHMGEAGNVDRGGRYAGGDQTPRHAPAAVKQHARRAGEDHLAGAAAHRTRQRAAGAEKDDLERLEHGGAPLRKPARLANGGQVEANRLTPTG